MTMPANGLRSSGRSGKKGTGRTRMSRSSAESACSTGGAPPVASFEFAGSATIATVSSLLVASTRAESSAEMASVPVSRAGSFASPTRFSPAKISTLRRLLSVAGEQATRTTARSRWRSARKTAQFLAGSASSESGIQSGTSPFSPSGGPSDRPSARSVKRTTRRSVWGSPWTSERASSRAPSRSVGRCDGARVSTTARAAPRSVVEASAMRGGEPPRTMPIASPSRASATSW